MQTDGTLQSNTAAVRQLAPPAAAAPTLPSLLDPALLQVALQPQQQAQPFPAPTGGAAGSSGDAPAANTHLTALQQMMHTMRTEAAAQKAELQQQSTRLEAEKHASDANIVELQQAAIEQGAKFMDIQRVSTNMQLEPTALHSATLVTAAENKIKQEVAATTLNWIVALLQAQATAPQPPAPLTTAPINTAQAAPPTAPQTAPNITAPAQDSTATDTAPAHDVPAPAPQTAPRTAPSTTAPAQHSTATDTAPADDVPQTSAPTSKTVFRFGGVIQPDGLPVPPQSLAATTAAAPAASDKAVPESDFASGAIEAPRRKLPPVTPATMEVTPQTEKRRVLTRSPTDEDPTETKQRTLDEDIAQDAADSHC